MSHEPIEKSGDRWDENEPALELYERWRKADHKTRIKAAMHLLSDSGTKGSNELARAAGVLVSEDKSMPTDVLRMAWTSHKFILKDSKWLDTFPNPSIAHELVRKEAMVIKDALIDSAGSFTIATAALKSNCFDAFMADAIKTLLYSDQEIKEAFEACKAAINDPSVDKKSLKAVASVFRPLVSIAFKKIYDSVSSGEIEDHRIFSAEDSKNISFILANDYTSGKLA